MAAPAALVVLGGLAIIVGLLYLLMRVARLPRWLTSNPRLRWLVEEAGRFREASMLLGHPRLLAIQAGLGALYLAVGGTGLYVILQGLGLHQISLPQALGVYAFSLAVGLLAPLPLDLGVIEVSGVGALVASGVPQSLAVSAMLLQRVLSGGFMLVMGGAVVATFKHARRAALTGVPVGEAPAASRAVAQAPSQCRAPGLASQFPPARGSGVAAAVAGAGRQVGKSSRPLGTPTTPLRPTGRISGAGKWPEHLLVGSQTRNDALLKAEHIQIAHGRVGERRDGHHTSHTRTRGLPAGQRDTHKHVIAGRIGGGRGGDVATNRTVRVRLHRFTSSIDCIAEPPERIGARASARTPWFHRSVGPSHRCAVLHAPLRRGSPFTFRLPPVPPVYPRLYTMSRRQ